MRKEKDLQVEYTTKCGNTMRDLIKEMAYAGLSPQRSLICLLGGLGSLLVMLNELMPPETRKLFQPDVMEGLKQVKEGLKIRFSEHE